MTLSVQSERETSQATSLRWGPSNDDELYAKAMSLAEPGTEPSALMSTFLREFIERKAAQRLAELGGSTPDLEIPPRRRSEPKT